MSKEYCQLCQQEHEITTACPNVRFGTSHEIARATRELQQWEYRVEHHESLPSCHSLNDSGKHGWEVVSIIVRDGYMVAVYFKRKK